jgi:hypothetical protein
MTSTPRVDRLSDWDPDGTPVVILGGQAGQKAALDESRALAACVGRSKVIG